MADPMNKTTVSHAAYFHGGPWHQRLEMRPGAPSLEVCVQCIRPLNFAEIRDNQPTGYLHRYRRAAPNLETMLGDFAVTIYLHQEDAINAAT